MEDHHIFSTEAKLRAHCLVCAERYLGINGLLKRLKQILLGTNANLPPYLGIQFIIKI